MRSKEICASMDYAMQRDNCDKEINAVRGAVEHIRGSSTHQKADPLYDPV